MDLPILPDLLTKTSDKQVDKSSQRFYESFLQSTAKDIDKYIVKKDEAVSVPKPRHTISKTSRM